MQYVKAWIMVAAAVLAAVGPGLIGYGWSGWGVTEWTNVGVLAAGAILVYNAANLPGYRYAKLIAACVASGGAILLSVLSNGLSPEEVVQVVVAILAAAGVGVFRNPGTVDGVFVAGPYAVAGSAAAG